jgi:hypothetical protein
MLIFLYKTYYTKSEENEFPNVFDQLGFLVTIILGGDSLNKTYFF